MITENLSTLKINHLTQEQYEREKNAGRIDENALYLTPEGEGITQDELEDAVEEALAKAKASGDFKGDSGYTPVKGVDYFDGKDGQNGKDGKDGSDATVTVANIATALGYTPANANDLSSHTGNKNNPHGVTASQLGLKTETWTFALEDGSTVTKVVYVG